MTSVVADSAGEASSDHAERQPTGADSDVPDKALTRPYVVRSSDLKEGTLTLMPGIYNVVLQREDVLPDSLKPHLSGQVCSAKTNGDGACAMHAVFGIPSASSELFLSDARKNAICALRTLPAAANGNVTAKHLYESLLTNIWVDFAVPYITGEPSAESRAFWSSLENISPALAVEARSFYHTRSALEDCKFRMKAEALLRSRCLFTADHESLHVRGFAQKLNYLPSELEVHVVAGQVRVSKADLQRDGKCEGLQPAHGSDGFIRGTRVAFPDDGPSCKYEALFDQRPVFDALREAFMTFTLGRSPQPFFNLARDSLVDKCHLPFLSCLAAWVECPTPLSEPQDFGTRCWEAYMDCISDDNFYLSIDELIAICLVESVNVAVFEEEGGVLKYAGGFFEAPGCVTCCKLRSNRLQRVRSHFERIITTMQLQDLAHEYGRAQADAVFAEEVQSWYDEEACNDWKLFPTVDAVQTQRHQQA